MSRNAARQASSQAKPSTIVFSDEAVRDWETKLAPVLTDALRHRRHGQPGVSRRNWHVDETYLRIRGRWC